GRATRSCASSRVPRFGRVLVSNSLLLRTEHDHQLRSLETARLQAVKGGYNGNAGVAGEAMCFRSEARAVHHQRGPLRRAGRVADCADLVATRANRCRLGCGRTGLAVSV